MGGRTSHFPTCPLCGVKPKELIYDKRDSQLKCPKCYDLGIIKTVMK